jgi:hypothetical protein
LQDFRLPNDRYHWDRYSAAYERWQRNEPPNIADYFSADSRIDWDRYEAATRRAERDKAINAARFESAITSAHLEAGRRMVTAGLPSWVVLRRLIYERDAGICWVCGAVVPDWNYECGHLVDRMVGGLDIPTNLAVMCRFCNRVKPVTTTIEETIRWRDAGAWWPDMEPRIRLAGVNTDGLCMADFWAVTADLYMVEENDGPQGDGPS